ncbi:hypothetical protein NDU88_003776 [Pleurodeles waltl]|uniref:Secreted protein n=1 Tax=Pleurodeles waltl TaxID=8319 RepID=A0AAV7PET2_PLEWA|nr:hypothetical protein NDU88_003776 [Pleurodeles waltl]
MIMLAAAAAAAAVFLHAATLLLLLQVKLHGETLLHKKSLFLCNWLPVAATAPRNQCFCGRHKIRRRSAPKTAPAAVVTDDVRKRAQRRFIATCTSFVAYLHETVAACARVLPDHAFRPALVRTKSPGKKRVPMAIGASMVEGGRKSAEV